MLDNNLNSDGDSLVNNIIPEEEANDFISKITNLKIILKKDIHACDMKWTLFIGAAQSYRYDSRLKPLPPKYIVNDCIKIDALLQVIRNTPPLKVLLHNLLEDNIHEVNTHVVELLHWVLISLRDPHLRSIQKKDFEAVMSKVPSELIGPKPLHIFQVRPLPNSISEQKFSKHAEENSTNFAFHGSKLDSFHSIINYGLQQHLSKRALYGEGIYLSSELQVSLAFSPAFNSWGASNCGTNISCVAICEYVEHPRYLNCHIKFSKNQSRDEVPEKYFVVTNNEIVRIRYLLVYGTGVEKSELKYQSPFYKWIIDNRAALSMGCYAAFLAAIGLFNSRNGVYFRQIIVKKAYAFLEKLKNNYF